MKCQKHLFQLPVEIHYLNNASMSPLLKSLEERGIKGVQRKRNPISIKPFDFFADVKGVRQRFGTLVNCDPSQVAVMPSAY